MQASLDKSKALPGEAEWQEAYAILEVWLTLEINSKIRDFIIDGASSQETTSLRMEQKKKKNCSSFWENIISRLRKQTPEPEGHVSSGLRSSQTDRVTERWENGARDSRLTAHI